MALPSLKEIKGLDKEEKKSNSLPAIPPSIEKTVVIEEDDAVFSPIENEEEISFDDEEEDYETEEVVYEPVKPYEENIIEVAESGDIEDPMIYDTKNTEEQFVDKKKKKIIPFGGKRAKPKNTKIKASDFDKRKNKLVSGKIVQLGIMSIVVIMFFVGLYNTFFPSHVYNEDQISEIAKVATGQTAFPAERGKAFAEDFIYTFLTIEPKERAGSNILSYYYTGDVTSKRVSTQRREVGQNVVQKVLIEPKVFETVLISDYSAMYKISAYVSNTDGTTDENGVATGRWLSFSVNVYYDKAKNVLAITEDSPSIIPKYELSAQVDVPQPSPLGNGVVNSDITKVLTPTIDGYIQAYASSSVKSHNEIVQYIPKDADVKLYSGFGGSVKINGMADESIKKIVYNTEDDNIYKIDVTVDWVDVLTKEGSNKVTYKSKYVMTIQKTSDGKYVVTKFSPLLYTKNIDS